MRTVAELFIGAVVGYLLVEPMREAWRAWRIRRIARKLVDGTYDYDTALQEAINEDPMRWW